MRAFRITAWEQAPSVAEADEPDPGPGEVRIRVAGNGLCHSDLTMAVIPASIGEALGWRVPFTLGHEVAGWVDALGQGVMGPDPGTPVALVSPRSCGACAYCLRGLDSACTQGGAGRGYGRDGGLAPYVLATPRDLIPLVTLDPITAGPLTDAGATAYHAVHRVLPRLGPGSIAVVIGAGGLGAFAVQLLRVLSAARVIAVDTNPARLAIAADLGAHETALGSGAGLQLSGTGGADAVLDFVGVDDTITAGVGAVAAGGAYALVGAGGGTLRRPWQATLPRDGEVFTFQGSCIRDAHAVVHLVEAGLIRNEVEVFPFDDVVEAYRRLDAGELRGRAVVRPPE